MPTDSAKLCPLDWEQVMVSKQAVKAIHAPRRMVFLALPQFVLLDLVGPWEVFFLANQLVGGKVPPYQLELVSTEDSGSVPSCEGISMARHRSAETHRGVIDSLIVPAIGVSSETRPSARSLTLLKRLAARSRRIVSICGGAMLLAEAGFLDGKRATTHWLVVDELAARYPKVVVEPDSIYVKDGNVYTSAGVTAGIDLALALVEEDLGRAIALKCARHLVMFMRRPGGQSQFSATLESQQAERSTINELIAWVTDNPASDLSVEAMSERVHMSLRNFSRVFRSETGQPPAAFVEKIRVEAARRCLEETDLSLEAVAKDCGFGSADSMRRSFQRIVKVAPSDYRRRFCAE